MANNTRVISLDEVTDAVRELLPGIPKVQIKRVLRAARATGYLATEATTINRVVTDRETTESVFDVDAMTALYKSAGHKRVVPWTYEHRSTNTPWKRLDAGAKS